MEPLAANAFLICELTKIFKGV